MLNMGYIVSTLMLSGMYINLALGFMQRERDRVRERARVREKERIFGHARHTTLTACYIALDVHTKIKLKRIKCKWLIS